MMFVDDTYLCHSAPRVDVPVQQLKKIVEHDIGLWYAGLHFSGGKLNLSKTNYFVVSWKFLENGTPVVDKNDINA